MRYALLVYSDQTDWADISADEAARLRAESMPRWMAMFEELDKADPSATGKELADASAAKVVRVRAGERIVTDGPFADTKEVIGGIFVTELPISTRRFASPPSCPPPSTDRSRSALSSTTETPSEPARACVP